MITLYYINLDESSDRRDDMESAFSQDDLVRIPAINGVAWASKEVDNMGRRIWDPDQLGYLISKGIVHPDFQQYSSLFPAAFGCNLSHERAWDTFLDTGEDSCIILEDDTCPTKWVNERSVASLVAPSAGVDMLYLFDASCPGHRIRLHEDGSIRGVRSLMGYWINRTAARRMKAAARPAIYQTDWQIPYRLFYPLRDNLPSKFFPDDLVALPPINAKGLQIGIIEHSHHAKKTTFTVHGHKPWLRTEDELP